MEENRDESLYPDVSDGEGDSGHEMEGEEEERLDNQNQNQQLDDRNDVIDRNLEGLRSTGSTGSVVSISVAASMLIRVVRIAETKACGVAPNFYLRKLISTVLTLCRYLLAIISGEIKSPSSKRVIPLVIFAVLYFLSPIDLIPDFIPIIGYLDDLLVVVVVAMMIETNMETFRNWEVARERIQKMEDTRDDVVNALEGENALLRKRLDVLRKKQGTLKSMVEKSGDGKKKGKVKVDTYKDDLDEQFMCFICMDNRITRVFLPCGHLCCCETCGNEFKGKPCPICMRKVDLVEKVFL